MSMTPLPVLAPDAPFFVVINAGSGRQSADEAISTVREVLEGAGGRVEFLKVEHPRDLPATAKQAVAQARQAGGVVVAAGGDGTLNAVAQAIPGAGVPFAVLPQGTFNYFGRVHGISQEIAESARALLHARVQAAQVGRVNGRLFLVNASLGLYPKLLEDREAYKQQFGRSRFVAAVSGLRTLAGEHRQLLLEIESGGEHRVVRTPTLFIGNNRLQLERLGFDEARALSQGLLAGVMLRPIGPWRMLGLALRGAFGTLGDAGTVESFALRRITVAPRGRREVKVAVDGEILRLRAPLVFDVAPEPLPLLMPAPSDRVAVE